MITSKKSTRRQFMVGATAFGGGMMIGVSGVKAQEAGSTASPAAFIDIPAPDGVSQIAGGLEFTPRLIIHPDDSITVISTKPEAGQGTSTTLAVFVCEELGSDALDESLVKIAWGDPRRDAIDNKAFLGEMDGFHTWFYGRADYVRHLYQHAGASARERLKIAAADALGVDAAELTVANNRVTHEASGESIGFGAIAEAAALVSLAEEPAIRQPGEWQMIGKPHRKQETPRKVSGRADFGIDVQLPGMVYAAVAQPPVWGATLKSYNHDKVMAMPGVIMVLPLPEFLKPSVIVVADSWWRARKGMEALEVEWEGGATDISSEGIRAWHNDLIEQEGVIVEDRGDALGAIAAAETVIEGIYHTPYRQHAPMEPRNATVIYNEGRIDVWNGGSSHDTNAMILNRFFGVPLEIIHTHAPFVGGAFGGGRGGLDHVLAFIVAQQMPGTPVKLVMTREEQTRQATLDPMGTAKITASIGEDGWPNALFFRKVNQDWESQNNPFPPAEWDNVGVRWMATQKNLANPTIFAPDLTPEKLQELEGLHYDGLAYHVENHRVEFHDTPLPVPTIAMRSPGLSSNVFMTESFLDEVAHATGKDPIELRKHLLAKSAETEPTWLTVLDVVAEKAEWGKSLPKGSGQGVAICAEHGTIIAAIAEVTVTPEGELTIDQVDVAFDCGYLLNEDGALNQLEGSTLFGWSMALNEEVTIEGGRIVEENFDTYPLARMGVAPKKLVVHLDANSSYRPDAALGEATVPHMAAAVANAIFAATGIRVRELPFRKADLSWSE